MKQDWDKVPKKYSAGCLLFWCVGYMPKGDERKRFNKWALEQMGLYHKWATKKSAEISAKSKGRSK